MPKKEGYKYPQKDSPENKQSIDQDKPRISNKSSKKEIFWSPKSARRNSPNLSSRQSSDESDKEAERTEQNLWSPNLARRMSPNSPIRHDSCECEPEARRSRRNAWSPKRDRRNSQYSPKRQDSLESDNRRSKHKSWSPKFVQRKSSTLSVSQNSLESVKGTSRTFGWSKQRESYWSSSSVRLNSLTSVRETPVKKPNVRPPKSPPRVQKPSLAKKPVASSQKKPAKKKGLSVGMTAAFIVAEMGGSVLSLPSAMGSAGWPGLMLLLLCSINAMYGGIYLGRCWMILENRWSSEYKFKKNRLPYPAIGERAFGLWMKYIVTACVEFTLIGISIIYLLLSAELMDKVAPEFGISFCYWVLIFAAILCPLMWFGSPQDIWPAAALGFASIVAMTALLVAAVAMVYQSDPTVAQYRAPNLQGFFTSFGSFLFGLGGGAVFPSFQNDMQDRNQFNKAVMLAFLILLVIYLPVAVFGFVVFGSDLQSSVVWSLPDSTLKVVLEGFIIIHLFFAFIIVINTPAQAIEEHLNVPAKFGWKRVAVRVILLLLVVFIAHSIPHFSSVLHLFGGSFVVLMTFVFPPLFYMMLCLNDYPRWSGRFIPLYEKAFLIQMIVLGCVGGCISVYSTIQKLKRPESKSSVPCYVDMSI